MAIAIKSTLTFLLLLLVAAWAVANRRLRKWREILFLTGPSPLNPYEQFQHLKPTALINYGVFIFDGHFELPLASAISHSQAAENLLQAKCLPEALSEAQQVVARAPNSVRRTVCWPTF